MIELISKQIELDLDIMYECRKSSKFGSYGKMKNELELSRK